jgi:phage gp46-like protein
MYNRFQGDIAVQIGMDGAIMKCIAGDFVRDQGFENAVNISLFTRPNYWGNIFFKKSSEQIGSDYQDDCEKPIVNISSINNITDAAQRALKWMTDNALADKITINVTNPRTDYINTSIEISPPGSGNLSFIFTKNGANWIGQANNPADKMLPRIN